MNPLELTSKRSFPKAWSFGATVAEARFIISCCCWMICEVVEPCEQNVLFNVQCMGKSKENPKLEHTQRNIPKARRLWRKSFHISGFFGVPGSLFQKSTLELYERFCLRNMGSFCNISAQPNFPEESLEPTSSCIFWDQLQQLNQNFPP